MHRIAIDIAKPMEWLSIPAEEEEGREFDIPKYFDARNLDLFVVVVVSVCVCVHLAYCCRYPGLLQ